MKKIWAFSAITGILLLLSSCLDQAPHTGIDSNGELSGKCLIDAQYPGPEPLAGDRNPLFQKTRGLPFPSDLFAYSDPSSPTGLRLRIPDGLVSPAMLLVPDELHPENLYRDADGFPAGTPVLFELDGPPDPATLPPDGGNSIVLLDLDSGLRIPVDVEPARFALSENLARQDYIVQAIPRGRLEYGHRYMAYLTKKLKRSDGGEYVPTTGMMQALSDDGSAMARFHEPFLDYLEGRGVERHELLSLTVFTVRSKKSATAPLMELVKTAYGQDHPVKNIFARKCLKTVGGIDVIVTGKVSITSFRDTDNELHYIPGMQGRQVWVDFVLYIPKSAREYPAPVCIYGHGAGMFKETARIWAEVNAGAGVATIAIDQPGHGTRALSEDWNFGDALSGKTGVDNFGEGHRILSGMTGAALDHVSLLKALHSSLADFDVPEFQDLLHAPCGDGVPELDTNRIVYQGTSLGAMFGATFAALAPGIEGAFIHVGGSNTYKFFGSSDYFIRPLSSQMPAAATGADHALFWAMAQQFMDYADNLNFLDCYKNGPDGTGPRSLAMAYSINDAVVPPVTAATMAAVAGMPLLTPVIIEDIPWLEHSTDFVDGCGLIQVLSLPVDLNPLELEFPEGIGTDLNGYLEHALGGLHQDTLRYQEQWLRLVLGTTE